MCMRYWQRYHWRYPVLAIAGILVKQVDFFHQYSDRWYPLGYPSLMLVISHTHLWDITCDMNMSSHTNVWDIPYSKSRISPSISWSKCGMWYLCCMTGISHTTSMWYPRHDVRISPTCDCWQGYPRKRGYPCQYHMSAMSWHHNWDITYQWYVISLSCNRDITYRILTGDILCLKYGISHTYVCLGWYSCMFRWNKHT